MSDDLVQQAQRVIEKTFSTLRDEFETFERYIESRLDEFEILRRQLSDRETELLSFEQRIQRQSETADQGDSGGAAAGGGETMRELEEARAQIAQLTEQIQTERNRRGEEIEKATARMRNSVEALTRQRDELRRHMENTSNELSHLAGLSAELARTRGELADVQSELIRQNEESADELNRQRAELEQQTERYRTEAQQAMARMTAVQQNDARQKEQIEQLREKLDLKTEQVKRLQSQMDQIQHELIELRENSAQRTALADAASRQAWQNNRIPGTEPPSERGEGDSAPYDPSMDSAEKTV